MTTEEKFLDVIEGIKILEINESNLTIGSHHHNHYKVLFRYWFKNNVCWINRNRLRNLMGENYPIDESQLEELMKRLLKYHFNLSVKSIV